MSGYSQSGGRYGGGRPNNTRSGGVVPFSQLRPSSQAFGQPGKGVKPATGARPGTKTDGFGAARGPAAAAQQGSTRQRPGGNPNGQNPQKSGPNAPHPVSDKRAVDLRNSSQQVSQAVRQEPWRTHRGNQFIEQGTRYTDDGYEYRRQGAPARRGGSDDRYFENFDRQPRRQSDASRPHDGWRGLLFRLTGINVGQSASEKRVHEAARMLKLPVDEGTVAVFSRKGGVGKTTITAYLGSTLASLRGGRIVALDGDAEAGSLGWLLAPRAPSSLAQLAYAQPSPRNFHEMRQYAASTDTGLDVIIGEPAENGVLGEGEMQRVVDVLSDNYDISLFDTGAGVTRATGRVLVHSARTLLLVMGPSVDSVRAAERTLAWLDEHPGEAAHPDARVIAVINGIPSDTPEEHIERIESHFVDRCSEVVRIPWDRYLSTGATNVDIESLDKGTQDAFVELAAVTVGTLAGGRKRARMRRAS